MTSYEGQRMLSAIDDDIFTAHPANDRVSRIELLTCGRYPERTGKIFTPQDSRNGYAAISTLATPQQIGSSVVRFGFLIINAPTDSSDPERPIPHVAVSSLWLLEAIVDKYALKNPEGNDVPKVTALQNAIDTIQDEVVAYGAEHYDFFTVNKANAADDHYLYDRLLRVVGLPADHLDVQA